MPLDALDDPRRIDPPLIAGEREMLEAWLDFHRVTLLLKCEGVSDEDRKRRPIPSSLLSLHGLVRHMTDVEMNWFQHVIDHNRELAPVHWSLDDEDADFALADRGDWEHDLAAWHEQVEAARVTAARHGLDDIGIAWGSHEVSLRWIYVHMIEEYARHNGHADLIREMIDGAVGD